MPPLSMASKNEKPNRKLFGFLLLLCLPEPFLQPQHGQVLDHLAKIESSTTFKRVPRDRELLRFLVEQTLAGRQAEITQKSIALAFLSTSTEASVPSMTHEL